MNAIVHAYGWPRQILYFVVRVFSGILQITSSTTSELFKRLNQSPGIPVSNPSIPYWHIPSSKISKHGSDGSIPLPDYADVVVLGSGITGTSAVRTLLNHNAKGQSLPTVVMLEARDACSGATGRNGGHISPVLYPHYHWLKQEFGSSAAKEIIRFRLRHLPQLLQVAVEESLLEESQCREVEMFDVFHDRGLYCQAKEMLTEYQNDLPVEGSAYAVHESNEALKRLQLEGKTVGCLSTRGGAIHPYRFVTGILERLLQLYPRNFYLFTHTPCTAIRTSSRGLYEVSTPKGIIEARHVIHATNAWASHLLPGMRRRIVPARAVMTAQIPRTGLGTSSVDDKESWTGTRSFVFYPSNSFHIYDYLTQQRLGQMEEKAIWPAPQGELMLGGGFASNRKYIEDVGNADDRAWNVATGGYLARALGGYFKVKGGNDSNKEKVKATWSGIIGISSDEMPWVGRVPEAVSGRKIPENNNGGEWIAAGYIGEGMVHAWLSGKAVAEEIVGGVGEVEEIPEAFRISEARWKRTGIEDMIVRLFIK